VGLIDYLRLTAVQHALIAATLVAVISGLIGPFVITRRAAFAQHGVAQLSFTGAVAGLVWANNPVLGALIGSLVVAMAIGLLGVRESERDAAIGVTLDAQLVLLIVVAAGVLAAVLALYRPLLCASVDPEVAEARGVRVRLVGLVFLFVLALTVTEAAQIVGTLLVLSLAITPAAAAHRLSARPSVVAGVSVLFALLASDGGLIVSLEKPDTKSSVFITAFSFAIYVLARLVGARRRTARRVVPIEAASEPTAA
jgi:zinc/manganese transport system permease protein